MDLKNPGIRELKETRELFAALLAKPKTKEAEWQHFFAAHPCVFSLSLPLRLEPHDIQPLGRPGKNEPDFIFFPSRIKPYSVYGVIEIKRPDTKIITEVRKGIIIPSRDAATAIEQATVYNSNPKYFPDEIINQSLFVGNRSHVFVIMGTTEDIIDNLAGELLQQQWQRQLPPNLNILPYDYLLECFASSIPPELYFLVPSTRSVVQLRSDQLDNLSVYAVKNMLRERDFFAKKWNKGGRGLEHEYEWFERAAERLVIDHATGLTWQQSGSSMQTTLEEGQKYVQKLNKQKFASHSDWRLPTLEEAMSLVEPKKNEAGQYIDSVFDRNQGWIWTADKKTASTWLVFFLYGFCELVSVKYTTYVRAVR